MARMPRAVYRGFSSSLVKIADRVEAPVGTGVLELIF
jgi:hypothetical protein